MNLGATNMPAYSARGEVGGSDEWEVGPVRGPGSGSLCLPKTQVSGSKVAYQDMCFIVLVVCCVPQFSAPQRQECSEIPCRVSGRAGVTSRRADNQRMLEDCAREKEKAPGSEDYRPYCSGRVLECRGRSPDGSKDLPVTASHCFHAPLSVVAEFGFWALFCASFMVIRFLMWPLLHRGSLEPSVKIHSGRARILGPSVTRRPYRPVQGHRVVSVERDHSISLWWRYGEVSPDHKGYRRPCKGFLRARTEIGPSVLGRVRPKGALRPREVRGTGLATPMSALPPPGAVVCSKGLGGQLLRAPYNTKRRN
nr:hypothetical protein Iba_chr12eCG7270 [Ipomoea batatas]